MNYGIANTTGRVPPEDVAVILEEMRSRGIRTIDTAAAYGEAEAVIGRLLPRDRDAPDVISKGAAVRMEEDFEQSLSRIGRGHLSTYLVHDGRNLKDHPSAWAFLRERKKRGDVGRIGCSVYGPEDILNLWQQGIRCDVIQCPYNVFDRRLDELIPELSSQGTEIHVRSVFLQGLAFLDPDELPAHLTPARRALETLRSLADSRALTREQLCLAFVMSRPWAAKVIVGVDSPAQFRANADACGGIGERTVLEEDLDGCIISEREILCPNLWP